MDAAAAATLILVATMVAVVAILAWCVRAADRALHRSEELLHQHLTIHELDQLDRVGTVHVPSGLTPGRVYVVPVRGSVTVLQDGSPVMRLCIRSAEELPGREEVLVHKINIQAAEEEYLRRANVVWRQPTARFN